MCDILHSGKEIIVMMLIWFNIWEKGANLLGDTVLRSKVKRFSRESVHKHTDGRTDATNSIISLLR